MTARRAFIHGAGGHGHVVASLLDAEVTFVVPRPASPGQLSTEEFFERIDEFRGIDSYVAIGANDARRRLFERLRAFDVRIATCVAPSAVVARTACVGAGAVLCPGCVVNARAVVGDDTIVNTLSSVDHDCTLGDHSQVTAGVTLGGTVRVGSRCFFGIKSAIVPNLVIGDDVIVMAGSLVTRPLPDGVTVGGAPARILRRL